MSGGEYKTGFWSRRPWFGWLLAIAAILVLLASFGGRTETIPVRAATAQRGTIQSLISTNGKIEPIQNFESHAPVGTTLKKLLVKEGDHVKKGQLLAELNDMEARRQAAQALAQLRASEADTSNIQAGGSQEELLTLNSQLVKARGARDWAQRNLDALQRLQQGGSASPGEVKDAENQLARADSDAKLLEQKKKNRYSEPEIARADSQNLEAQAAYAAAEDVLTQLNIRAPFDGIVYSLPVRQGAYVNLGDLVLQEADLSKVLVRAFVDEPDVGRVTHGQPMEATWDALPDRVWKGTVADIPATLKLHGTRNVGEVTCVLDNKDDKLLPNVNVGVTIIVDEHQDALTVPREALRQDDRSSYVLQIVNNELKRKDVTTAISNLTHVEISHGLDDNALVALNSINSKPLQNGSIVKVVR